MKPQYDPPQGVPYTSSTSRNSTQGNQQTIED